MNPAVYILATLIGVVFFAVIVIAAYYVYDFAVTMRKHVTALEELAAQVNGLPWNLRGIVPAITGLGGEIPKLAAAIPEHTAQLKALVQVIETANRTGEPPTAPLSPKEPPPPFLENGPDTNWNAEIPERLNLREEEP